MGMAASCPITCENCYEEMHVVTSDFTCEALNGTFTLQRIGIACHWRSVANGISVDVSCKNNVWYINIHTDDGSADISGSRIISDNCPATGAYEMLGICNNTPENGKATLL
jgi:hypothetical protein